MENSPFVSIIVPVYNGEATIRECIESLLRQSYSVDRYEIIVVDNGSKDGTADIVKGFSMHYLEEKAIRTSYAARNRGIKEAKGQILAFIDSDCVASPDWLVNGIEGFKDTNIGCVAGGIKGYEPQNYVEEYLCKKNAISQEEKTTDLPFPHVKTANAFYIKDVFTKIGLFEDRWISGGDADLSLRMQLETGYKIKFSPQATVFHKHRSTLVSMFKQSVKWGIGYSLLCKKYRRSIPKRNLRQVIWVFWHFLCISIKVMLFCFLKKNSMSEKKRTEYLDFISFMGWEVGRIAGSIRNRVFCI